MDATAGSRMDESTQQGQPSPESMPGQSSPDGSRSDRPSKSRRDFLADAGRTLAYVAPVVLLFDPPEALAASGMSGVS